MVELTWRPYSGHVRRVLTYFLHAQSLVVLNGI